MDTFRERFPSKREAGLLFAACVFPIHLWSIVHLFYEVPAMLVRLSGWDLIGSAAYALVYALLESVLVLLTFLFLAPILPGRLLRDHFVAQGTLAVFLSSAWAIALHSAGAPLWYDSGRCLAGFLLYVASLVAACWLIDRLEKLEKSTITLVERLVPIAYVYVGIDILAVLVILFRNFPEAIG